MGAKKMTDQEFMRICDKAIKGFGGNIAEFERAVGTLFVARYTGWKPIYLMQDRKSLKKYEEFLGIKFQEAVEDEGDMAQRSLAWKLLTKAKEKLTNFWKVVRGEADEDVRSPEFLAR
jgi:hypothetical protein